MSSKTPDVTFDDAGVAKCISAASDSSFQKESKEEIKKKGRGLHAGEVVSIRATGKLRKHGVKYVINTLGPLYNDYRDRSNPGEECLAILRLTVKSSLIEASKLNCKSVALPSISAGIHGVPTETCAKAYWNALIDFISEPERLVEHIHFVDINSKTIQIVKSTFQQFWQAKNTKHEILAAGSVLLDLDKVLGRGGFASVFKANFKDTAVAVKIFDEPMKVQEIFDEELAMLLKLEHPNVVQVYGISQFGKKAGIVLEIADFDFAEELEKTHSKTLTVKDIKRIIKYLMDVAMGLVYLHNKGILHLDLKPHNILIIQSIAKITDFGLSNYISDAVTITFHSGTPMFMPPEAFQRSRPAKSFDIWSFGITMIQAMTGEDAWDNFVKVKGDSRRKPDGFISQSLPKPVSMLKGKAKELVIKCLAWDPSKRPSSSELVTQLSQL